MAQKDDNIYIYIYSGPLWRVYQHLLYTILGLFDDFCASLACLFFPMNPSANLPHLPDYLPFPHFFFGVENWGAGKTELGLRLIYRLVKNARLLSQVWSLPFQKDIISTFQFFGELLLLLHVVDWFFKKRFISLIVLLSFVAVTMEIFQLYFTRDYDTRGSFCRWI